MKHRPIFFVLELFIPVLVILIYYVLTDPFKFIKHYDSYYDAEGIAYVDMNNDYVSTATYDNYHDQYNYDSFIFGNSRSRYFLVDEWKKYIDSSCSCYHFDASNETLLGINLKIKYVDRTSEIHNCLLILDNNLLSSDNVKKDSYLFYPSPQITTEKDGMAFQLSGLKTFFNPKFMFAYTDLLITGTVKPYMREWSVFNEKYRKYNVVSNETRYPKREKQLQKGTYYSRTIVESFPKDRSSSQLYAQPVLKETHIRLLKEIKEIFIKNHTNYKIIISPVYDQIKMADSDYSILKNIFGEKTVYDFSGINNITQDYHNYYDNSHYTSDVCSYILNIVYSN